MDEYPVEVRQPPLPLVTLISESRWNPLRKQLADHFLQTSYLYETAKRDSYRIMTRHSDVEEPLPERKEKRLTYEFYRPPGIFKSRWISKHLHIIPSATLGMFAWDDEGDWRFRELSLSRNIDRIKENISVRNTKFILVLIQEKKGSQDPFSEERYLSLRRRCDLDNKAVIVFQTDDFANSIKRLEKCILEWTHTYFREEARRIKKNKDFASKKMTQPMITRLYIKIAFYAECRFESAKAIKYYLSAYNALQEVTDPLYMNHEIKSIAELLNFKICILNMTLKRFVDAIEHFKRHIKIYKRDVGPSNIDFLHWAWLSRQYCVFAELLENFSYEGNAFDFYHHPGYYFHDSALYQSRRRHASEKIQATQLAPSKKDTTREALQAFVGQHHQVSQEDLDDISKKEYVLPSDVVNELQLEERKMQHSEKISYLLTRSLDHFTKVPMMNFKHAHILVMLAEEYYVQEKYDQAISSLDIALPFYEEKAWDTLSTRVLSIMRNCIIKKGNIPEFCRLSLLLMTPRVKYVTERSKIFNHIKQLVGMSVLLDGPFEKLSTPVSLFFKETAPFLPMKMRFDRDVVYVDTKVNLQVLVESHAPSPLTFTSITFHFDDPTYNQTISRFDSDTGAVDLYSAVPAGPSTALEILFFEPQRPKLISLPICVKSCCVIKCERVVFCIGSETSAIFINIDLPAPTDSTVVAKPLDVPILYNRSASFVPRATLKVIQPQSRVSINVSQDPPAVLNEFFAITITLRPMDTEIVNGTLEITERIRASLHESIIHTEDKKLYCSAIQVPPIKCGEKHQIVLYAKSSIVCKRDCSTKFSYVTEQGYNEVSEQSFLVEFVQTFTHKCSFTSLEGNQKHTEPKQEAHFPVNSDILLKVEVESHVRTPILVKRIEFHQSQNEAIHFCRFETSETKSDLSLQLPADTIHTGGKFTLCVPFHTAKATSGSKSKLGGIRIAWARDKGSSDEAFMNLSLPEVIIYRRGVEGNIELPPKMHIGNPVVFSLLLRNTSVIFRQLDIRIESTPHFIFAGNKYTQISIGPMSEHQMNLLIVPLVVGASRMPAVDVMDKRENAHVLSYRDNLVYVLPSSSKD